MSYTNKSQMNKVYVRLALFFEEISGNKPLAS